MSPDPHLGQHVCFDQLIQLIFFNPQLIQDLIPA